VTERLEGPPAGGGDAAGDAARLAEELAALREERDRLLALLSHDLKNPLSAIHMNAAALQRMPALEQADPVLCKRIDIIRRAADRMNLMLQELTDYAAVTGRQFTLRVAPNRLGPVLRELIDARQADAGARSVRFELSMPHELPPVVCDRARLGQAVGHMLGHALRNAPDGSAIAVGAHAADGALRISVRDPGPPVPADQLGQVFDPWWRGASAPVDGHRLALPVARHIVVAHGGRVGASTDGAGTELWLTLPIDRAA
jgi:signal transduction histidine kinase